MIREHLAAALSQTNRYSAALRKLLSIKGEAHDISYGVHLEDERPEHSFIKGEYLFAQFNEITSAAGTLPVIGVTNPAGSGNLVVVTSVYADADAAGVNLRLGFGATYSGVSQCQPRDTRWIRAGVTTGNSPRVLAAAVAAAAFDGIYTELQTLAARAVLDFTAAGGRIGPIIISPGLGCWVGASAVGVNVVRATFVGYCRSLESGELI